MVFALVGFVAAQLVFTDAASAEVKIIRMKHVSYDDLKSKCAAEGGEFDSVGKTDYWCSKAGSHVICDTKNCTGATGTPKELDRLVQQRANPNSATGTLTTE
jgi:hypothetical protein